MFDHHQAEITVMQFRGPSLPVHQSMSVSWTFTLSHFVSQIRLRDFFRLLAIGMCHFLPVHHFGMACLAGSKVNIQYSFPYFVPKLFGFLVIWLLVGLRVFFPYWLVDFFFFILESPVLILPRYLFSLPSFTCSFWFISSSCAGVSDLCCNAA